MKKQEVISADGSNDSAVVWFTNNLRTADNRALSSACRQYDKVCAVYCFDKSHFESMQFGFKKIDKFRARFLIQSVQNLAENLKELNITLFVYFDYPASIIPTFVKHHNVHALFYQRECTSEELSTINDVKSGLDKNVKCYSNFDQFLYEPESLPFKPQTLPEVFTHFRKQIEKNGLVKQTTNVIAKPASNRLPNNTTIPTLEALGFHDFEIPAHSAFPFKGGENAAAERLDLYFFQSKKLSFYKQTRNGLLGTDYSSKFSPWLANGCLSARTIYWKVREFEALHGSNQSTYWLIFELLWRDYFKHLSIKHGTNLFTISGIKQLKYDWKTDSTAVSQWINGNTSEPFVNANMLELKETGWMSNRGRQNVASYFCKELLLDWRIGAAYFESMLIDYDVHSNYGNWQYVAGVGNDPRDRKFNVKMQAQRYDTTGKYQRTWLQKKLF